MITGNHNIVEEMISSRRIPDPPLRHLFDGMEDNVYNDDICNLCAGTPGPDLLRSCTDIFNQATKHRMEHEKGDAFLFQYGATAGPWDFREELSRFLSRRYEDHVCREDLVLTCGATHGLQLILNCLIAPNGVIFVEDATYMIAITVFRQFSNMKIVPVTMTESGVDVEALERTAREEKSRGGWLTSADKPFWAMFYSIPVHHNPTGVCAIPEVCEGVVRAARALDFLVVCDDVYNLLDYSEGSGGAGGAVRRLFAVDRDLPVDPEHPEHPGHPGHPAHPGHPGPDARHHVVSNGSFSKILAPGVRVGWLELPGKLALLLRQSGILRSGGGVNTYMAGVITSALQLGLIDTNLDLIVGTLKGRMRALCDALDSHLPPGCAFHRPSGGYFVWLRLPDAVDSERLSQFARESRRVSAFPGAMFSPVGKHRNCVRLAVAFHSEERIAKAGRDFCDAIRDFLGKGPEGLI